jgi:hypothetical protein
MINSKKYYKLNFLNNSNNNNNNNNKWKYLQPQAQLSVAIIISYILVHLIKIYLIIIKISNNITKLLSKSFYKVPKN